MEINFREMIITDYENAIALWRSLPGIGLSSADEKSEIAKFLNKNPTSCWIAEHDSKLVGTILGGSDGRRGYIYHLAVNQSFQNQRVGKSLLQRCLQTFRKIGIQKCHLLVIPDNTDGIAFWKHARWVLRDDVLVMSKELII